MRTSAAGASSVHCPVHAPRSRRRFVHHVARWFAEHLVGLCKDRLSIDITSGAPQPASPCGALRHTLSGRVRGPSSWFLPTSTVCATGRFAGLLHPAADHEVHRVSAPAVPSRCRVGRSGAFPPMLALQSIPLLRSRAGVTADRCPLACKLPPAGLEALLHARVRCVTLPLPTALRPWLSWASRSGASTRGPCTPVALARFLRGPLSAPGPSRWRERLRGFPLLPWVVAASRPRPTSRSRPRRQLAVAATSRVTLRHARGPGVRSDRPARTHRVS